MTTQWLHSTPPRGQQRRRSVRESTAESQCRHYSNRRFWKNAKANGRTQLQEQHSETTMERRCVQKPYWTQCCICTSCMYRSHTGLNAAYVHHVCTYVYFTWLISYTWALSNTPRYNMVFIWYSCNSSNQPLFKSYF